MGVKVKFYRDAWWVFINHGGRRKSKRVGDRVTADALAKVVRERLARGDLQLPIADDQTFAAYAKSWLQTASRNLKASTLRFYRGHLDQHILPALGNRPLSTIRRADCRDLVTNSRAKGLKVATVRGIARTLSTILSQAVEDELLPGNPALRLGRYLRNADAPEPQIDPFTREEVAQLLQVARERLPEWYPWLLCGLRTGMRAGELLALQWGDFDWRGSYLQVRRNLVRGQLTTPKNHQQRRVDLSRQLRRELRLWRRRQRAAWLKFGQPFPEWVFPSVTGTALDESNVRKMFNHILDAAGLHHRGPHQMRHTFASLLLQDGAPITYVSRQLGHKDASITLRVYAHWIPDGSSFRAVDLLDETQPSASQAHPTTKSPKWKKPLSPYGSMVSQEGIEPSTRRLRVCCSAN
jgi:integrase